MSRKFILCTILVAALLSAGGCKKKPAKTQETPSPPQTAARKAALPGRRGVAEQPRSDARRADARRADARRADANRPASSRPIPLPAGPAAPPAGVAKAVGQTPGLMIRANLAAWWKSPLTTPLLAHSHAVMKKAFRACAAKFPLTKLTKAFFVQSASQIIRRAADSATDSHYIVFAADFDVPALFSCLAKAGTYKRVTLGGATAYQATKTPDPKRHPGTQTSWWFAPTPRSIAIVDGPWARKVTPGKGLMGTGALLAHVGPEALRVWAIKLTPDLLAVQGFLNLQPDVHGRAELTWRDARGAQGAAKTLQRPKRIPAFLAPFVKMLHVSVRDKTLSLFIRLPIAKAKVLVALLKGMFASGSSSSKPSSAVAKDKAHVTPTAPPKAIRDPMAPKVPREPMPPRLTHPRPK